MVRDIPETLVEGKEREYLTWFYSNYSYNPAAITKEDIDEYVSHYSAPGGMRAGFEYYRALPTDVEQIKEYSKEASDACFSSWVESIVLALRLLIQ